jgi:ATP-dependent Clp protease ATP-binding subunit ClpC
MFERFTDEARQVVVYAQEEARALGHDSLGTAHLLLGILRLPGDGIASGVLDSLGVTFADARDQLVRLEGRRDPLSTGQIPFAGDAQRALEESLRQAHELHDRGIAAEHLLLALVRHGEGQAARVLADFDVGKDRVRAEVRSRLGEVPTSGGDDPAAVADARPAAGRAGVPILPLLVGWFAFGAAIGLGLLLGWLIWG